MNCPICGKIGVHWATAEDVEYLTNLGPHHYLKCDCGVVYLDDPPIHQLGEIYPSTYYSYSGGSRGLAERVKSSLDRRTFARALRMVKGDAIRTLDVGGGAGYYSDVLRQADSRVTSTTVVDLDNSLASINQDKGHIFVNSRIEDAEFDKTFHVIIAFNLIEHVADPKALVNHFKRLLEPEGLLLLQTPNFDSLDARLFRESSWGGFHAPRHWVLFRAESLTELLTSGGFRVETVRHIQGAPFWAVGILAKFPKLRRRSARSLPMYKSRSYRALLVAFGAIDLVRCSLGFRTSQMFAIGQLSNQDLETLVER